MTARKLDHIVLATASLDVAKVRLEQLGFTVAPEGVHPFGTYNSCVYFSDETFLEALAVKSHDLVDSAILEENSFVLGDQRFRRNVSDEGISAVVFSTNDAKSDALEFQKLGISGGDMVQFSRPSLDMKGRQDTASFLLAFAASSAAPSQFFFSCERQNVPLIDRSTLQQHANGTIRVSKILAQTNQPLPFAEFLAKAARSTADFAPDGSYRVMLANSELHIKHSESAGDHTILTAIVFGVGNINLTAAILDQAGIHYEKRTGNALFIAATNGQGADFIFEELLP